MSVDIIHIFIISPALVLSFTIETQSGLSHQKLKKLLKLYNKDHQ